MKKFTASAVSFLCIIFLVNLTNEERSVGGGETLHKRNFYAVVVYRDTKQPVHFVDNLSVSNMLKFKLYTRPSAENIDEQNHIFKIDPRILSRTTEDTPTLDSIDIIEVPNPSVIWKYVRNEDDEKKGINTSTEFIEIRVYSADTSESYFIDLRQPLMGNKLGRLTPRQAAPFLAQQEYNTHTIEKIKQNIELLREDILQKNTRAKSIPKTFAYPQLKRVFIGGWKYREEPGQEPANCKPCAPCVCPTAPQLEEQFLLEELPAEHEEEKLG